MPEMEKNKTEEAQKSAETRQRKSAQTSVGGRGAAQTMARKVIVTAVLLASSIVLSRFVAIRTPIITINFTFLPLMLSGMLMGWRGGIFVAVVADLIGALLFPSGSFFIGYTLTAALKGLIAGLLLYDKNGIHLNKKFVVKLIICVVIWCALLNGVLNTLWVFMMSGSAANLTVPVRVAKQLVMAPIMVAVLVAVVKIFGTQLNELSLSGARRNDDTD